MPTHRLSIIGLGLLGGSIGIAARERLSGCHVTGYDASPDAIRAAKSREAIDAAAASAGDAADGADLVVVAVPISQMAGVFRAIAPRLSTSALVTDVGSTKQSVCRWATELLPIGSFVGGHPMAGGERAGVADARADLFDWAACILSADENCRSPAVDRVAEFWSSLGSRVVYMLPDAHDRAVSQVSHLPHVVAAALMAIQTETSLGVAGRGFADVTRIAAGDAALWRDILIDNREFVNDSLTQLITELQAFSAKLQSGDASAVRDWLSHSATLRNAIAHASAAGKK